jgi:hypothetical protein
VDVLCQLLGVYDNAGSVFRALREAVDRWSRRMFGTKPGTAIHGVIRSVARGNDLEAFLDFALGCIFCASA